jgi:conjugal transfer pilus assembly protein TraK
MLTVIASVSAHTGASVLPVTLNFVQGSQFPLTVSDTNPNMIFVPGDRITAISGPAGAMTDKRQTESGGVIFSTTTKKPFTFYLETEQGQTVSVAATPTKGQGRVYRLIGKATASASAHDGHDEQATSYEALLVSLNRAVATGHAPDGYSPVTPLLDSINLPAGIQLTSINSWADGQLRVDVYRAENTRPYGLSLKEQHFWKPGVRSVMFDTQAKTLMPRASMMVFVIQGLRESN